MVNPRTPILVSGAQFTQRTVKEKKIQESLSPIEMLAKVARAAIADGGAGDKLTRAIDTISIVRFTADSPGDQGRLPKRMFRNPPLSVAKHLGITPRRTIYTATGGNTPQWLVNRTAEEIARGECEVALLAGAEYIGTLLGAMKAGVDLGWGNSADVDPGSDPEEIGDMRAGVNDYERSYGLHFPVNTYPLFENAIRGIKRRSPSEHLEWLGKFFSPFTRSRRKTPIRGSRPIGRPRKFLRRATRTALSAFPTPNI